MIIKFYVNGMCVDTYRCVSTKEQLAADQLCAEDKEAIDKLKRDAYNNYGYPAVTVMSPACSCDDDLAPGAETL